MFTFLFVISILSSIYVAPKYPNSLLMLFLTIIISFIELFLYFATALKNPGIIIPSENLNENCENGVLCNKCSALRIRGSYHCGDCGVCIKGWDHHCLWTGKCIGEGNACYFWGFLAWTTVFLSYQLGTTLGVMKQLW